MGKYFWVLLLVGGAACSLAAGDTRAKYVLVESVSEVDDGANGTADSRTVVSYEYNGEGRLDLRSAEWDFDGDGVRDHRSTSSITYNGQQTVAVNESYDLDEGLLQARAIITDEYDADGNRTRSIVEADSDAEGTIDYIAVTTFDYEDGRLMGWVIDSDRGADGNWDDVETVMRTYDTTGNLRLSIRETDNGRDGQIENRRTSRFIFDGGKLAVEENEIDHGADGILEFRERTVYAYDRSGTLRSSSTESETQFEEGVLEFGSSEASYFYDSHGNQVRIVQEDDWSADGTIDSVRTTNRIFERVKSVIKADGRSGGD